jgi:RNA polymerase sigma-70 factor (ECF subfamily)
VLPAQLEAELPALLPSLRALARRLLGNPDEAEDAVQEALLRASAHLARFRAESTLKTWLFSITTRVALDQLRQRRRWNTQAMVDACDERGRASVESRYAEPAAAFDVNEHIAFCLTCVGRTLEPEAHAALVLREVLELPHADAAAALEVTESVYRHALAEGRAAMEAEFEGLCALVKKEGACYQCRALRDLAPAGRRGPPLPGPGLSFEERLRRARGAAGRGDLDAYFFSTIRQLQG